jgi:hypothetical protein
MMQDNKTQFSNGAIIRAGVVHYNMEAYGENH